MPSFLGKLRDAFQLGRECQGRGDALSSVLMAIVFNLDQDNSDVMLDPDKGEKAMSAFSLYIEREFYLFSEAEVQRWEAKINNFLDRCPTDEALQELVLTQYRTVKRQSGHELRADKKTARRLYDQIWKIAGTQQILFTAVGGAPRMIGLADWETADIKGICPRGGLFPKESGDKPAPLPPERKAEAGAHVEPYPGDALSGCMAWTIGTMDTYVRHSQLTAYTWNEFCKSSHPGQISIDHGGNDQDGGTLSLEKILPADDSSVLDIRTWEYESMAKEFIASLPGHERAVLFKVIIPLAYRDPTVGLMTKAAEEIQRSKALVTKLRDAILTKYAVTRERFVLPGEEQFFLDAVCNAAHALENANERQTQKK